MEPAAAALEALEVHAAVDVRHVNVVSAPGELRRERRDLPFGAATGQRQNDVQDSHELNP
jgi:hypothetical protein